jgi:benzoylformate decarboxylase
VLVVGAPAFRQMPYAAGPFVEAGTLLAVLTDDPEEAYRSAADPVVVAPLAAACRELARVAPARTAAGPETRPAPAHPDPPADGEPLQARHVLAALADRLPRDAIVLEEAPADRPELHARLRAREPLGYLGAAMGGLGFALPGAAGVAMALPDRPVVAVVGDGAAIYGVPALWSAARYGIGVLYVVLSNGGYAVMDILAELQGTAAPWPGFPEVEIAAIAAGFGCPATRIESHAELTSALDEAVPALRERREPLLLDVVVAPTRSYDY